MEGNVRQPLIKIYQGWSKIDPENEHLKRVKTVLDRGTAKDALNKQLFDALRIIDVEMAKGLLAKSADVIAMDESGQMPLEVAADTGSMEMMKLLLESGADLKRMNRYSRPALEAAYTTAMLHGHEENCQIFPGDGG